MHAMPPDRWQQMMRARVGIDTTKSWADQAEEEEETAMLITTAGVYEQTVQKRGAPLREGFTIVKVRAARLACNLHAYTTISEREIRRYVLAFTNHRLASRGLGDCVRYTCIPECRGGHPGMGRSYEICMHLLAFTNDRLASRSLGDHARCACM